jgi:6-phosphogluconolactonase
VSNEPVCLVDRDPVGRAVTEIVALLSALETPRFAIPGGSAAAAVKPIREALGGHWLQVLLTYTDERCVPFDSLDSTRGELYRSGALDMQHAPGLALPLYLDDEGPAEAAARASLLFNVRFDDRLDVVLLGLGPDGHVASLFPGQIDVGGEAPIASIEDSPKPPAQRVTLTRSTLLRSTHNVVLAFGSSKREARERALRQDPALPTSGLPGLIFITDQAATWPATSRGTAGAWAAST